MNLMFRGSGACGLMEHKVHSESARRSSDTFCKSADGSKSLLKQRFGLDHTLTKARCWIHVGRSVLAYSRISHGVCSVWCA